MKAKYKYIFPIYCLSAILLFFPFFKFKKQDNSATKPTTLKSYIAQQTHRLMHSSASDDDCIEASPSAIENSFQQYLKQIYQKCSLQKLGLDYSVFERAAVGYFQLKGNKQLKKDDLLTIIDFTKPSSKKRLYTIDIEQQKLLHHSLVAHGRNTGMLYAEKFSNRHSSLQSSLGFYRTGGVYQGEHGYSMYLDGLEKGVNDQARPRAIVMHPADYASPQYLKQHGRLGRSWGCPALPPAESSKIINSIKSGSCLFIYANQNDYLKKSRYGDWAKAINSYTGSILGRI